ncbi:MAG: hypothetical protein UT48_C0005G0030 [Parcubacteria group bacterium GW2011_GWE2_39_37]|uniref:Polymerase nucleotidyl transferase domain-containing protein n=1 Tax=Candidatus Falkowbacteria bacterium GW2011_GWF2_39_8 TaxID=1618642 RepID=A0A0G0PX46_9BACT|nr:MAG: hypothetical protein UT48_C0005G0030 [Parcubacteria group bacterium GW2011_GWE2_39_37]KKR32714.1 MAG: hypothetical protein UT64_C0025G0003 [Candidatus Falkowbacteria bacterium GW2011_GWF2_39_8]
MENSFNQEKNDSSIEEAIIKTVAFFDMFDYPLTSWEIWKFLFDENGSGERTEVDKIIETLESTEMKRLLQQKESFYFLAGRDELISIRKARYNFADKKLNRAVFISKIFRFIPWIKFIGVVNSYGSQNLKEEGDIDLFIITAKHRIWLVRFFCVLVTKFLGLRPKSNDKKNKICLSFYMSEEKMDLSNLVLPASETKIDRVFINWLCGLNPIYDPYDTYDRFNQANEWRKKYLPNWQPILSFTKKTAATGKLYYKVVDFCLGWLESGCKNLQHSLMAKELKEKMNLDTRVVINDQLLKLHSNDKRQEYNDRYKAIFHNALNNTNGKI